MITIIPYFTLPHEVGTVVDDSEERCGLLFWIGIKIVGKLVLGPLIDRLQFFNVQIFWNVKLNA